MELRTVWFFGFLLLTWSVECHLLAYLFSHLDPNLAFPALGPTFYLSPHSWTQFCCFALQSDSPESDFPTVSATAVYVLQVVLGSLSYQRRLYLHFHQSTAAVFPTLP